MFGKVKKWLGIEGVKVEIHVPEEISGKSGEINGALRFHSMNTQTVTSIKLVLIERFTRGRGEEKLIDEYKLGEIEMHEEFEVPADEILEVDFVLPFEMVQSDVDRFASRNALFRGIANMARLTVNAKSVFRLEAEATVKGTALNPLDKKEINLKF